MKKKKQRTMPEVSTASLPDIIFMLLFFFMVVTVMRTDQSPLDVALPATEHNDQVKQVQDMVNIHVGKDGSKVAVNEQLVFVDKLESYLESATASIYRDERMQVPVYLRVDKQSPMGVVYKVKLALRKTGLRKVNYIVVSQD